MSTKSAPRKASEIRRVTPQKKAAAEAPAMPKAVETAPVVVAAPTVAKVVEVVPVEVVAPTEVQPTAVTVVKKVSVKKPAPKVVGKQKPATKPRSKSKSPAKAQTKSKSKSPAKSKHQTKSRSKSVESKTSEKKGSSSGKKATSAAKPAASKTTAKRVHNVNPTQMDKTGIGIGPARVKAVLMTESLNPVESRVRRILLEAENKPRKPKPKTNEANPAPEQGPQTPVDQLDESVLKVVRDAENLHEENLRAEYENWWSKNMPEAQLSKYREALAAAKLAADTAHKEAQTEYNAARLKTNEKTAEEKAAASAKLEANPGFNLHEFNLSYPHFFDGFEAWRAENDSYTLTAVDKHGKLRYNEWTRVAGLVNKMCIRLSGHTRVILACFLDRLVEQYTHNGIENCLEKGKNIVHVHHALGESTGFAERVPLDLFVRSFKNHAGAYHWLDQCAAMTAERKRRREEGEAVDEEEPKHPDYLPALPMSNSFEGYVGEICRSVKLHLAQQATTDEKKAQYLSINFARDFKRFCSYIVYEAILRIGDSLRNAVRFQNVKTISDNMVYHVLQQIHSLCGVDYEQTETRMNERLTRFEAWRVERSEARATETEEDGDGDAEEEDVEAEAEVDGDDGEEVEVEYEEQ